MIIQAISSVRLKFLLSVYGHTLISGILNFASFISNGHSYQDARNDVYVFLASEPHERLGLFSEQ